MEFSHGEADLFEIESNNNILTAQNLPIYLFQEIEAGLCDKLLHGDEPENDQTDAPLEFIKTVVNKIKEEFEGFVQYEDRKTFLKILSKIFTILLSIKADNTEKIIKIVRFAFSIVLKVWSEQKWFQGELENNGVHLHLKEVMENLK